MSLVADALQPSVVSSLFTISRAQESSLSDIIMSPRRHGFYINAAPSKDEIALEYSDAIYLGAALAGDARRLTSVSYLSLQDIANEVENATTIGWAIIKLYYAAFYAGHSVLRLLGRGCSYFSTGQVRQIHRLALAMGVPVPGTFESGMYHCLLTSSQTGFLITRRKHPTGTHEVFWKILIEYFDTFTEQILVGHLAPVDPKDVFTKFGELRAVMKANGASGGSWLSMVPNEVQYRHQYGVWHPCNVKKHRREAIGRIAAQWKRDPMDVDLAIARPGELETFAGACAFIVALSRALLARIAERSFIGGRSFARASFA